MESDDAMECRRPDSLATGGGRGIDSDSSAKDGLWASEGRRDGAEDEEPLDGRRRWTAAGAAEAAGTAGLEIG